jgi:hypothetical protein
MYFHGMLHTLGSWTPQQQDFFRDRAIQAAGKFPRHTVMLVDDDELMKVLGRYFAPFKGTMAESGAFGGLTERMAEGYPQLRAKLPRAQISNATFHGYGSPADFFYRKFEDDSAFKGTEVKRIKQLLAEGAAWERKYPKLDFQLPAYASFIEKFKKTWPRIPLRPTWRGYRIRDVYAQLWLRDPATQVVKKEPRTK